MDEAALTALIAGRFEHVTVVVAGEDNGAPEVAWGDTFFHYGEDKMPFVTIVTKDYPGWDEFSDLNRPGVWRLNIGITAATFATLFPDDAAPDFTALDRLLPHPTYARQHWVSILNPSDASLPTIEPLLAEAHAKAATRRRRGSG